MATHLKSVFIVAVENSGDQLGAALVREMRTHKPHIDVDGIGGAAMAIQNIQSDIDISALSVLGFVEALKVYPIVLLRVKAVVAAVMTKAPDAVVLIDSWGFMIRVAKGLKRAGYEGQIIKYVAPQVWAMREGRAKILTRYVDHLLTIHSFDAPYFTRHDLPTTYVGNPVFDMDYQSGDGEALRQAYGLAANVPIIGVMFGSRGGEVARLAPTLAAAAMQLKTIFPDAVLIAPIAFSVKEQIAQMAKRDENFAQIIQIDQAHLLDAFGAMDVALACSGTVTTQLASAGIPTIVSYKVAPMTYIIGKRLFKPDYMSIVNIAADAALMPEFMQDAATPDAIAAAAKIYLDDPLAAATTRKALLDQTASMQGKGGTASERAALKVLNLIGV